MLKRIPYSILKVSLIMAVPPFLLLTNVNLLTFNAFVRYEYGRLPPAPGFGPRERLRITEKAVLYLRSDAGIELLGELRDKGEPLFREKELAHMVDVKVLWRRALIGQRILGVSIALLLILLSLKQETRKSVLLCLAWGSLLSLILPVLIAALAYLNFDWFFVRFHQLFFAEGSWIFDYSDTLIQLFPVRFWFDAFHTLAFLSISEAALFGAAMYWVHGKADRPTRGE